MQYVSAGSFTFQSTCHYLLLAWHWSTLHQKLSIRFSEQFGGKGISMVFEEKNTPSKEIINASNLLLR